MSIEEIIPRAIEGYPSSIAVSLSNTSTGQALPASQTEEESTWQTNLVSRTPGPSIPIDPKDKAEIPILTKAEMELIEQLLKVPDSDPGIIHVPKRNLADSISPSTVKIK